MLRRIFRLFGKSQHRYLKEKMIEAEQVAWAELRDRVMALPSVHWVGLTAGASDFVVLVRARDLDELRDVVLRDLLSVPGIRNTQTSVLLEEARPEGSLI